MLKNTIACCAAFLAVVAQAAEPFSFGVFGDTPYNGFERRHLPALIAEMDAEPLKVVIHDGDLKSGGERCDDALFNERLAVFQTSRHPFVFVPGDNDWTDCHRSSNGAYDPLRTVGHHVREPLLIQGKRPDPAELARQLADVGIPAPATRITHASSICESQPSIVGAKSHTTSASSALVTSTEAWTVRWSFGRSVASAIGQWRRIASPKPTRPCRGSVAFRR